MLDFEVSRNFGQDEQGVDAPPVMHSTGRTTYDDASTGSFNSMQSSEQLQSSMVAWSTPSQPRLPHSDNTFSHTDSSTVG